MPRSELDGCLADALRFRGQRMTVKFGGGDGEIRKIRTRFWVALVVIVEGCLHNDRFKRGSQRHGG